MIANPLQINNLEIKKFLLVVLAMQLAMLGLAGLAACNFDIPVLRQIIGFIYITFIPGLIILRILKLRKLGAVDTLLYSTGLSLATLMFIGFVINLLLPFIGISTPFSTLPLLSSITVVVLVLCLIAYQREKHSLTSSSTVPKYNLSPVALALCFLPLLSIFGTHMMNSDGNNIPLMVLLVVIAAFPIVVISTGRFPKELYPLAISMLAISLLYHVSLISVHLWGRDIHIEYYLANLTINGYWDSSIGHIYNAMLSATVLPSIYSAILSIDLTWVFKAIYPLLFSLVPVCLYQIFQRQVGSRVAFLAAFLFMSIPPFIFDLPQVAREEIAMLFLVLLTLAMLQTGLNKMQRAVLLITFAFSLVVSHYGLCYLYVILLLTAWLLLLLINNSKIKRLLYRFQCRGIVNILSREPAEKLSYPTGNESTVTRTNFILLSIVCALAWYIYISAGEVFYGVTYMGSHIISSLGDLLDPEKSHAFFLITAGYSGLHGITKVFHLVAQFFIVIGILDLTFGHKRLKFHREFVALSITSLILLVAFIVLPYLSGMMSTDRIYHATLIFLAPFCITGGIVVFNLMTRWLKILKVRFRPRDCSLTMLSIFLAIYFIFSSGFAYYIANDKPTSFALSNDIYPPHWVYSEAEFIGAEWLVDNVNDSQIYAGHYERYMLYEFIYRWEMELFEPDTDEVPMGSYLYLGQTNTKYGEIVELDESLANFFLTKPQKLKDSRFYTGIVLQSSKIYTNGDADVYQR